MRLLKENEIKVFEQLVSLSQPTLLRTMGSFLRRHYKEVKQTQHYMYAVGNIPVALVAHLDTVFSTPAEDVYYDTRKNVIWSPDGLGADDRAGVYAITRIIRQGLKPHIIFTTDEEIGGVGAAELVKKCKEPFADMKYIIELDRRGTSDCVFYDCDNQDFTDYVESFGFIENFGTYSDISEICPVWGVAGVNLSIGYEDEHSISETLHINPFLKTIDRVVAMLKDAHKANYFKYIPSPYMYKWYKRGNTEVAGGWGETDEIINCSKCHQPYSEYELFPVKGLDGKTHFHCPDCIVDNVHWCTVCGEAFEVETNDSEQIICNDCGGGNVECLISNKLKVNLKK